MDIQALQVRLRDFATARDWQAHHAPKNLVMALMVEAAELLELFQWTTITESRGLTRNAADKERVADEIADVLLYLLQLADHTDVDVEEAVERKLRKNAEKYPAKHPVQTPAPAPAPAPAKIHLLVDWENVQPTGDALKALLPEGTNVWLFHGPRQKLDDASHRNIFGDGVVQVPRTGSGKNALDFQLTYYMGYISARQQQASFVIVSNDQGYDPMLEHVRELGFNARRCEFHKGPLKSEAAEKPAPAVIAPTPPVSTPPVAAPTKKKTSAKAVDPNTKATRQDMKHLNQTLQDLEPWERPGRRDTLLVLIQTLLGEANVQSPRVAHALAQLQALKRVAIKDNLVSYPPEPAAQLPVSASAAAKKKAAPAKKQTASTKKTVTPTESSPAKTKSPPTAAQIAKAVLASLKKMPKNKPTRRSGLLKVIETHASKAVDPKAMAQQVCSLLEARKEVALSEDGKSVSYPA